METVWDGITTIESLKESVAAIRNELAESAKKYDWARVFELLLEHKDFVNTSQLGGNSLFTPLHQAAHGGASIEVVQHLIELGAWRTIQNSLGERAVDVAERKKHRHLHKILMPVLKRQVPTGVLLKIQFHFHSVIRERIDRKLPGHDLRLPEIEPLLELDRPEMWFPVPGMYGGFSYRLESVGDEAKLVSESWCRVVGGSGQRHEITSTGSRLVEKGFV